MSGDVQPRKRKDKKRKKDELGLEEPRGTAAVLGEGDVFIHSYHEHGTGGHWCAKIIFFSLLAILVTLIGLIILENRGLSELEANSVESRYSGVLEGWIDDAPEDDHHDEHTLELKHSDDEELTENDHEQEIDEDDDHDEEENNEEMEDINDNEDGDDDQSDEEDNEDIAYSAYRIYEEEDNNLNVEEDSNEDDGRHSTELKDEQSEEEDNNYEEYNIDQNDEVDNDDDNEENDDENSDTENEDNENDGDEWQNNEEDHVEDEDDDDSEEVERIEREVSDEEILSSEVPIEETKADDEESEDINENDEDSRPIQDDDDEPPVERITLPPAGKPYTEIEEETIQKTPDTLAEEEEYEKQQEELRREREAQSSQAKGGGNSIEDDWPGEPSDPFWSQQLDLAEEELRQGAWSACERRASVAELRNSARAQWLAAKSLDLMAEAKRDNRLLSRAIAAYLQLLKMNEKLPDQKLIEVVQRAIDRIQFRGTYLNAEPVYRLLIRRFPDNIHYRNNLTVCFLMANRADLAGEVLKEALRLWPNDRVALAHYGFVLKNQYNKLEEAVIYLQKALEGDAGAANEPRFHYHLGDALLQLGRLEEAHEVHKRGTALGHFLSPAQRSLYNVPRLKSRPWWPIEETPYAKLATALENSWREILKEGLAAKALYEKEKEGLKERGEWSQLDIFVRGQEIPGRCKAAPVTCSIVRREAAAGGCRRGQVKFSAMAPGTHVRPHVGPTNCRLRMHLGLSNTKDTYIRVDKETRQWEVGKVFIFDDSFEHEVWHNGTGSRLVLIVDVWHPDLTPVERRTLPAI